MTANQETPGLIYSLIPRVMADIGGIAKTRKNEQQKYSFRGIEDFYLAAHPAMIAHGIFCAPSVIEREVYRYDKANYEGKLTAWVHVALKVEHRFYASDGSFVSVTTCGEGLDNSDKASNKAMSGAMKYALIELFCVPTQDVEDSDRTTPEVTREPAAPVSFKKPGKLAEQVHAEAETFRKKPLPPLADLVKTATAPELTGYRAGIFGDTRGTFVELGDTIPEKSTSGSAVKAEDGDTPDSAPSVASAEAPRPDSNGIQYSTEEQQTWLRLKFKEALPAKYRKDADSLRRDWLKLNNFVKPDGTGSSTMIPRHVFKVEAKRLLEYARSFEI